jgi:hypothetical protein
MRILLMMAVLALAGLKCWAEELPFSKTKNGYRLFWTGAEIEAKPLTDLEGVTYEAAVAEIRKAGIQVVVTGHSIRGGERLKLDRRSLNTAPEETLKFYESFFLKLTGDQPVGAIYLPVYFEAVDPLADVAGIALRPDRDREVILVARNGSLTALIHEYMHALIHRVLRPAPVKIKGVLHDDAVARGFKLTELAAAITAETRGAKNEKKLAALTLEYLETTTDQQLQMAGQEMDIALVLLARRKEQRLNPKELVPQALVFATAYRRLEEEMAEVRGSGEWTDVRGYESRGVLSPEQIRRKKMLIGKWDVIETKLAASSRWWDENREALLLETR